MFDVVLRSRAVAARRLGLLPFVLASLTACRPTVRAVAPLAPTPATLAQLPPCELAGGAALTDTTGWTRTTVPELGISFLRPRDYVPGDVGAWGAAGWMSERWRRGNGDRVAVGLSLAATRPSGRGDLGFGGAEDGTPPSCALRDALVPTVVREEGDGTALAPRRWVAEWAFSGGRQVRLSGMWADSATRREHLAMARSVRFVATPVFPAQCPEPLLCPRGRAPQPWTRAELEGRQPVPRPPGLDADAARRAIYGPEPD